MRTFLSLILLYSLISNSFAQNESHQNHDSLTQRFKHAPMHVHDTIGTKTFYTDSLLHYADKFLGVPYIMGGHTPKGFDCSGFTMYCFKRYGIPLPHSAHDQALLGHEIHLADAQPGDLLFFQGRNTNDHSIHHVAIFVHKDGNRIRFIHAASHTVHYNYLDSPYYGPRLVKARRVIKLSTSLINNESE